ncbi:MAG: N-acetylmuramoyl-L-alanine amidase [Herbinix sp.]|nr:N-acetylmuramoyl-L-alanine amidase [Herbinix sp.]
MEKALLKRAAFQSVALMLGVIMLSFVINQYNSVAISASGNVDILPDTQTEVQNVIQKVPAISKPDDVGEEVAIDILDRPRLIFAGADTDISKDILELLGEKYLVVRKPQGGALQIQLEDLYLTKNLKLTISGIMGKILDNNCIGRVNKEDVFIGEPKYIEKETAIQEENGLFSTILSRDYGNDFVQDIQITSQTDDLGNSILEVMLLLDHVYVHNIYEDEHYFYIDIKSPKEVYDKILVIDAGHGGKDPGAVSRDELTYEKNINLGILLELKELLDKENIKVYYTRIMDDKIFLTPRVALANDVDCDFFISIHNNSNGHSKKINGTEILYYDHEHKSIAVKNMAKIFIEEISKTSSLRNNGLVQMRNDDVLILNHAKVPAIIVEAGYMSNINDLEYLNSTSGQEAIAEGIYKGILRAYEELMP